MRSEVILFGNNPVRYAPQSEETAKLRRADKKPFCFICATALEMKLESSALGVIAFLSVFI